MWSLILASALAAEADPLHTQAEVHVLDNGLTVILDESRRTDTVALHIAYGVGARDEREGEFGCAHLFEHLMFEGSKNVGTNMFDEWLTSAGGSNNAWTSEDTTAYHETFPSGALDLALFLESDRMGFLDAGLDAENVANQQKVVLQERNEGYAEPNGRDWDALSRLTFHPDHPYHHPVIGSVADIEAFEVEKVRAFWADHYRSRNAVLVLVGAIDKEQALERVRHWFADVPDRGEPRERLTEAPKTEAPAQRHGLLEDDVNERTVYLAWQGVPEQHPDAPALQLLGGILSGGRGTPLDDALYYERELATEEGAFFYGADLAGQFFAYASHHKTPLKKLHKEILAVVASLGEAPPTPAQLDRARQTLRGGVLDRLEAPWNRAEVFAECFETHGDPNCADEEWARYEAVTPDDILRVARAYLVEAEPYTLSVVPRGDTKALPGAALVELP